MLRFAPGIVRLSTGKTTATTRAFCVLVTLVAVALLPSQLTGQDKPAQSGGPRLQIAQVRIPKIERAPKLEDFLDMQPSAQWHSKLARVEGFIQRAPDDGKAATQQTEVYLGYDERALYVIFVAHDSEPQKIRARLDKREGITLDEDQVGIYIDTFHDLRRAYQFECNALGVQDDSTYSEDSGNVDESFDTVWSSRGQMTARGFVVWMSIPFKSLRFRHSSEQTWAVAIWRWVGRRSEGSWWPQVSFKTRGILSQAATANGLESVSPGRNLQFIPYLSGRAFHGVDARDPSHVVYDGRKADINAGLDTKIILKDSLVLDLTAKPDFSQVESDDPQTTINQRFEVFFPEKRPFFTENTSYFDVPMSDGGSNNRLLFTRRIADPDFGARLTGRIGKYSIGSLFADDKSAGEIVPVDDPLAGKRAYFDVFRVTRDLPRQSNVGAMFTERRFQGTHNRVLDFDGAVRLDKNWTATLLGANSWTRALDGTSTGGRDVEAHVSRQGRGFNYDLKYVERAPEFLAEAGYIFRNDVRYVTQDVYYQFWPQRSWLTKIKPELDLEKGSFFHGGNAFFTFNPSLLVEIKHQTTLSGYMYAWNDGLRPQDYPALTQEQTFYGERAYGFTVTSSRLRLLTLNANYEWGPRLNYVPPTGQPPGLTNYSHARADLSVLTSRGLTIDNTYIFDRSLSRTDGKALYNSHILRSKWNWQLNRELSLRFIAQYNAMLANSLLTSTPTRRNFNADFLFTYLVHPGTAIYLGYNSNVSRPGPPVGGPAQDRFVNDGRQFFVKVSYLFRF